MKTITWDMVEQFTFPVGLGAIEDVVSVQVTPQWEQSDDGQSIRLSGIYHVMASVQFNPVQQVEQVDGTYIEHIDIEQSTGYFEYALPLDVDLPSDKVVGPITLAVNDIKTSSDAASCQFTWQVQCNYTDPQAEVIETLQLEIAQHEPTVKQQEPVKQQVAEQVVEHQEPVKQQAAQHTIEHQEQVQHTVVHPEVVQQEPVAYQESSLSQIEVHKPSLQDEFFADLTDTYSVFNANLNNIRS
ncbi:hypothetical protein [Solibacillus sp. CAU 1738]|uniref:hypothetical protein n=1 Tax=Solibacillus sp. CAU 1738 TaxID=3140363 RepID=UPI00326089A1